MEREGDTMSKDLREQSKGKWNSRSDDPSIEDLKLGCLLRIADATERMSGPYLALLENVRYWRNRADGLSAKNDKLRRSNAALRGVVARLKKKL